MSRAIAPIEKIATKGTVPIARATNRQAPDLTPPDGEDAMCSESSRRTPGNDRKLAQLQSAWNELLEEVLRRDYFGTASIELNIQEGTIQHFRRTIQRLHK